MPRIGRIDIPDTLWAAMVEQSAKVTINNDLETVRENAGITTEEMDNALAQLEIQDYDTFVVNCDKCVIALIRIQTGNFLSDDEAIERGQDFRLVQEHITQQAEQINHNILSSDKQLNALKTLLYSQSNTSTSRYSSSVS